MKKLLLLFFLTSAALYSQAQHEGRIGFYTGFNRTSLMNADDKAFGDYLPTAKACFGASAGYHFTVGKILPMGFTFYLGYNQLGQNYRGFYADTTNYYAYSRLNYMRYGLGWHVGTNIRRLASVTMTFGLTQGILTGYQERYELLRQSDKRTILDIHNTTATITTDTLVMKGTVSHPLYNKTDKSFFISLDADFMLSQHIVFGISARMDKGLSEVENLTSYNFYFNGPAPITQIYTPYSKLKYRAPEAPTETRGATKNMYSGIYLSLKYRLYNPDKMRIWYQEHRHDWF